MLSLKQSFEYYANYVFALLSLLVVPSRAMAHMGNELSKEFSCVFSNVPGPRFNIVYNGHKSMKVYFFSVPAGSVGLSFGVYSHNEIIKVSLAADKARMDEPEEFMEIYESNIQKALDMDLKGIGNKVLQ